MLSNIVDGMLKKYFAERCLLDQPFIKNPEITIQALIDKMVEGRLRKYLAEICLTGQPFVKDPDVSIGQLLEKSKASVSGFLRFEVGEGIEKKQENFAAEVMAQVEAAKGRA